MVEQTLLIMLLPEIGNAQQSIIIATPSPPTVLINFWPKMRNESNENIGLSRLIKKLMQYETKNCLRPYKNLKTTKQ